MPLRYISDFKQALSTLQRLQQEAGEEPHVRTYLTSTNNGSKVLSAWGDPLLAVFGKLLRKRLHEFNILLQMDRRSTLTDGEV